MKLFRYKLMRPNGQVITNVANLPFEDLLSVTSYLERDGNIPIWVKKVGPVTTLVIKIFKLGHRKKLTRAFIAEFLGNVAMMIRAGIPIVTALEESAVNANRPDFESDINDLILNLQGGATFSAAAQSHSHIFPKSAMPLIRIGETSGTLDERLKDASEHLKRIDSIIRDTKQALLYPAFVFAAMFFGLIFWLYYVVPKIIALFDEMDVTLPALTVFIIKTSEFVQANVFELVGGVVLTFFIVTTLYKKSLPVKRFLDYLTLKLPVVGTLTSASTLAFISEYFAMLINAGIDILQVMKIMEESVGNEIYREKLKEVQESLTRSETIADSFTNAIIFPRFVCRMIKIGETSGTLSDQLEYIAEEYRTKLATLVATLGKMIEPIVLIVAGAMFAIIIGGLFLPIYDLVGNISSM